MANFENFLAVKYIKSSKGKERFISFSSLMSILGIIVGVAALIIVMGVMNGFDKELEKKILDITPHVFIKNSYGVFDYSNSFIDKLKKEKGVKFVYPLLTTQGMLSCCNFSTGIVINGINPNRNNPVEKYIIKGKLTDSGVVIGYELAKMLGIGIGETVRVILPFGKTTPFGFAPLSFKAQVSGIFKCGMYDYDSTFVYIPLSMLWNKTNLKGKINTIAIELKEPFKAEEFSNRLAMQLPENFYTSNWIQINSNFFTALKLEKTAMFIILLLVVLVAAFNITSSLTMMVMEKTKEIAILRSLGATEKNIKNIFIKQAAIIGVIGVFIGDVLGITLSFLLKKYHFIELPKSVYYITTIPVDINLFYIALISILSFLLVILSGLYPASKASKLNIVQVLRS
ncbi:FtsX-like permease family protein [Hippea alviniae]|uniref:FtsX-like permease family protein n=1 Tax=Hippea alviniae TaxID=1279027 RepID=UPI0003B79C0E|nr:FtsX-like permease family protein [Hippea alviniae]